MKHVFLVILFPYFRKKDFEEETPFHPHYPKASHKLRGVQ
jgi:hypothetical protein